MTAPSSAPLLPGEPEIRPVLADPASLPAAYRRQIAQLKRFAERFVMDAAFRAELAHDGQAVVARAGLAVDPEEIRPLWDAAASQSLRAAEAVGRIADYPLAVRRFRAYQHERRALRRLAREAVRPRHPRMAAWHERQIRRCRLELGELKADQIVHAPVAFELARGCSVGCWFCGVGAGRLEAVWQYRDNRGLWRDCLQVVHDVLGAGAACGFCYWATEPLDNPDYEKFCTDFEHLLGRFPPLTTAVPTRDLERTRRLCAMGAARHAPPLGLDRFSILSPRILDQVHAAFSPEELLRVELVPVTSGSLLPKVRAGGARLGTPRPARGAVEDAGAATTIACVSGFLFNMPERRVRLISPCRAGTRWPLGYRVYGERTFDSPGGLRRALGELIERGMAADIQLDRIVSFTSGIAWQEGAGWRVRGRQRPGLGRGLLPGSERIVRRVAGAGRTAAEIALALEAEEGAPLAETFAGLDRLFQLGLLDDDPAASPAGEAPV